MPTCYILIAPALRYTIVRVTSKSTMTKRLDYKQSSSHYQAIFWCIGSNNGLAPTRRQAIFWTNDGAKKVMLSIIISLTFIPIGSTDNKPVLNQLMSNCRTGNMLWSKNDDQIPQRQMSSAKINIIIKWMAHCVVYNCKITHGHWIYSRLAIGFCFKNI